MQEVGGRDVVHAGVAENGGSRGVRQGVATARADDDAEFAFEHHLAVIAHGAAHGRVGIGVGRRGLDEIQRLLRFRQTELGPQGAEVVPQRDHLRGPRRCHHPDGAERHAFGRGRRTFEHVAGVNRHRAVGQGAELGRPIALEAHPLRHRAASATWAR